MSRENSLQTKEQGQLLGEPKGLLQPRFPEPSHEHTIRLVQYWCPCDGWKEVLSHTPAFTDTWRRSAIFAPKFIFPRLEPPFPALLPLFSQLSSLSIPHLWFYFCCLLQISTFLLYPILWVIPLHLYSSVFSNVLPLLPWLFSCSYCRFSH